MVEYMEWLRESLTLAADTYNEVEINFPNFNGPSQGSNEMVCIQSIEIEHPDGTEAAIGDYSKLHVSDKTKSAIISFDDDNCIEYFHKINQIAGNAGFGNMVERVNKYPKELHPYKSIFFGGHATKAGTARIRIGYTIRNVNKNELMRSLIPR